MDAEKFRQRLISALDLMRDRSATLAGLIANDLPEFTVHDASHSDGLWVLADRIAGPDFELSPVETFVFGAAVLLHDLGLASAAYVNGPASLEEEPRWTDTIVSIRRQETGRIPSEEEIANPESDLVGRARRQILRELHAEHAEQLATTTWEAADGKQYALLDEPDLRAALGAIVGRVAHSHWWPVSALEENLPALIGAPPGMPADWTVRPLVLACLLRLADASHLDGTRAPRFLRLLRAPSGEAAKHWDFQERLLQPVRKDDRFVFTAADFGAAEAEAWWLCADTLSMVDHEFRSVDSFLADHQEPRFVVRGVAGVDDPTVLATHIPTKGWTPIDAKVRVSNVVRLVERLGGRELYGARPEVPLRELIQNGSDAVRARRAIDERPEDWGSVTVTVRAGEREGWYWLEVEDTGVGMSREVLTDDLLDFGVSFWESERVIEEFPGLLSSGFEPVGRFGIGFFSIFMWGDDVDVVSRRHDASIAETNVLEFRGGVARRPLLRPASTSEQLRDPGTRVRVLLDSETIWSLGLSPDRLMAGQLQKLCAWLAPASDVSIGVEAGGKSLNAVAAGDWKEIPLDLFGERISGAPIRLRGSTDEEDFEDGGDFEGDEDLEDGEADDDGLEDALEETPPVGPPSVDRRGGMSVALPQGQVRDNARPILDEKGEVVGRLAVDPKAEDKAIIVIGGLQAGGLSGVVGVLLGRPVTASRSAGAPIVSASALAKWASEQAQLLGSVEPPLTALEAAEVIYTCGGDTGRLPIAAVDAGPLSREEVAAWARERDRIVVIQDAAVWNDEYSYGALDLADDVILVGMVPHQLEWAVGELFAEEGSSLKSGGIVNASDQRAMFDLLVEVVRTAWGIDPGTISDRSPKERPVIGVRDGLPVKLEALVWERPAEA